MKKQNKIYIKTLAQRINGAICCNSLTVGRSNFLLGCSLLGFSSPNHSFFTSTVCRNENLLNTMSASHNAIYDIITNSKLNLLEKQLKIEELIREY